MIGRREFLKKIAGSVLLAGCGINESSPSLLQEMIDNEYDYSSVLVQTREDRLDHLQQGVYLLTAQHVYRVNETSYRHNSVIIEGTATAVSSDGDQSVFLLTNHHNLMTNEEEEIRNGYSDILSEMRLSGYETPTRDQLFLTHLESRFRIHSWDEHNHEPIGLMSRDAASFNAYPVAGNGELDVAVIQCTFPPNSADYRLVPAIGDDTKLRLGNELWVSGFAERRGCRSLKGVLSGFFRDGGYSYQVTDIDATDGQSGGPVSALMDGNPELVGIAGSNESWRFAGFRGISEIRQWLEDIELPHILPEQNR